MLTYLCYFRYTFPQLHRRLLLASAACLSIPVEIDDAKCLPICLLSIRLESAEHATKLAQHCILVKAIFEIWAKGSTSEELTQSLLEYTKTEKFTRFVDAHPRETFKLVLETRASTTHSTKQQYVRENLAMLDKRWQLVNVSSQNETQHVFWLIDYTADKKRHVSESDVSSVMFFARQVASGTRQLVSQCKQQPYRGPSSLNHELAVIMATLGHVTDGSAVLDPFVGTGTILLACALLGAGFVCGSDIDNHVIRGSGTLNVLSNFTHFALPIPDIVLFDCTHNALHKNRFDAIVCDPPYGLRTNARSGADASLVDHIIWQLIVRAADTLVLGGQLVFLMPTSSDTTSVELFTHSSFSIDFVCLFELGKQWNRALVVMKKVADNAVNDHMKPALTLHKLDTIKLPKQARVLEENCITYLQGEQHSVNDAQIQANVWEIIRRNEFQNFLDKFVVRGGSLSTVRDDKAKNQLIHYAAAFDRFNFIEYLIEHCININARNGEGSTPLHIAARWGHLNTVQWIVGREGCEVDAEDNEGNTPLMWAVKWDHIQIVQLLIDRSAVITKLDRSQNSVLHWAARFGFLEIAKLLLSIIPDLVHGQNAEGSTPIHLAARWGHLDLVRLLLQTGFQVQTVDEKGDTLLHECCFWGRTEVVQYLLDLPEITGITPLKNAAGKSAKELASLATIKAMFVD